MGRVDASKLTGAIAKEDLIRCWFSTSQTKLIQLLRTQGPPLCTISEGWARRIMPRYLFHFVWADDAVRDTKGVELDGLGRPIGTLDRVRMRFPDAGDDWLIEIGDETGGTRGSPSEGPSVRTSTANRKMSDFGPALSGCLARYRCTASLAFSRRLSSSVIGSSRFS
jgi:hypothetical protein